MGILNYKGFPSMSISAVENLASTALVLSFLALGVFGIVELGGLFNVGKLLLS
jgi:hypothetical protein